MKKCKTCNNESAPKGNFCYKCTKRKYRTNNPIKSSFQNLRSSAKKRNIPFSLTLKQFKKFCYKTKYIQNKGITKNAFHVDRIKEDEGYFYNNIQVLKNTDNVKKYIAWAGRDPYGTNHFTTKTVKINNNLNDVPF